MKGISKKIISMILCFAMIMSLGVGLDVRKAEAALVTGTFNIDTDELPYTQEEIYDQLFDINNKIEINLDISDAELQKIQNDYSTYSSKGSKSPIYRMADVSITITTDTDKYTYVIEQTGVRMKGNTSRNDFYSSESGMYNLIHWKFDFQETFDDEAYYGSDAIAWPADEVERDKRKDRTFATLEKLDVKWNRCLDTSYIREHYTFETFRANGVPAPHTNLASTDIAGSHMGVYVIYEPIDKIFIKKYFPKAQQGGDLYKCGWADKGGADFTNTDSIGIEDEDACKFYAFDLKTNKKTSDNSTLKNLITTLNSRSLTKDTLNSVVDMDNFLKFSAVSYFMGNPDDLRNNYNNFYVYFRKDNGKAVFIPYDFDRTLGVTNGWNPTGEGMTNVSPFSANAEGNGTKQINPLYKYTVCPGGYYILEYGDVLKNVAGSKWLTTAHFDSIYAKAVANYANDVKPDKDYNNAGRNSFVFDNTTEGSLSDTYSNMSFKKYITTIMATYKNEIANIEKYLMSELYIRGDFNGWQCEENYQMNYSAAKKQYYFKLSSNSQMIFKINNGIDGNEGRWYGKEAVSVSSKGITITTDADGNIILPAGTYTVYFNYATGKINITLCNGSTHINDGKGYRSDSKYHWYVCECGDVYNKKAHTIVSKVTAKATTAKNGKITNSCNVCKKTLSTSDVSRIKNIKLSGVNYTYNGKVKTPTVTVKDLKGNKLVKDKDYTVTYAKGRKNVGKYSVKVTFKGKYSGSKTLYFKISPKSTYLSSLKAGSKRFTAKWKKQTRQVTGYQIQYSTSKKFTKAKTVTVKNYKSYSKTIKKLAGRKKYYVRIRTYKTVNKVRYYSVWSAAKTVTTKR